MKVLMTTKILAVTSAFMLSMISGNTLAAQTWTLTTKGIINAGVDVTGVFGFAGQDLKGKTYSQSITTSTDPRDWKNGSAAFEMFWGTNNRNGFLRVSYIDGTGPGFTTTYTVDGHAVEFTATSTDYGGQVVGDNNSPSPQSSKVIISNYHEGRTADGDYLRSYQSAEVHLSGFVPSAKFNQTLSQSLDPSTYSVGSSFSIYGRNTANFDASANYFSISSVPEPETYAMLLAGLGLIGFVLRHRKAQV